MANVSAFTGAMPVIPGGTVEIAYVPITSNVAVSGSSGNVFFRINWVFNNNSQTVLSFPTGITGDPYAADLLLNTSRAGSGTLTLQGSGSAVFTTVTNIATANFTTDGGPLLIEFSSPLINAGTVNGGYTSGSIVGGGGSTYTAGTAFLRVSKIVNQNDGLKPFWTPPVVTQLPSQATVGDQVIYAANATDGVYWHLQYDGLGTYPWKFIGGSSLNAISAGGNTYTPTANTWAVYSATQVTAPLAGDYYATMSSSVAPSSSATVQMGLSVSGATPSTPFARSTASSSNGYATLALTRAVTGVASAAVLSVRFYVVNATVQIVDSSISLGVTPIRVSA